MKFRKEHLASHTLEDLRKLSTAFHSQKVTAGSRKDAEGNAIKWELTFDQWLSIWVDSGKLSQRGKGIDQYCMSRTNDIGPYAEGNVEIIPFVENLRRARKAEPKELAVWRSIPKAKKQARGIIQNPYR